VRLLSLFLSLALLAWAAEPAEVRAEDAAPLRVGMELSYPPFEMTDTQGTPSGVSVDLAQALADYLHRPLKIENMPFDGLIPALKTGRIDLILSSMTATPERARSIDFSQPYLRTGLCLLTSADSKLEKVEDLNQPGIRVAVKKGTTGHLFAVEHLPQAKVLVLDREQACVLEVVQHKADVFIYDQMSVLKNWQENQASTRAVLRPFREEAWAVGIRKGNDTLREQVDQFLAKFSSDGGFERLGDKYLKEQKEAFAKLGYPFFWSSNAKAPASP